MKQAIFLHVINVHKITENTGPDPERDRAPAIPADDLMRLSAAQHFSGAAPHAAGPAHNSH